MKSKTVSTNPKLLEVLKTMKTTKLQQYFNEYDKQNSAIYIKLRETMKKVILCKLIIQAPELKGTEQDLKARKFLERNWVKPKN